jgi:L-ascorbate metabolism protein UlaG (beta-lactamase superfamily)
MWLIEHVGALIEFGAKESLIDYFFGPHNSVIFWNQGGNTKHNYPK